jgi:WD40 repeat protein
LAYDAFISYSHAADGRLAPALQSGLQRLAKPWYRVRALRVFRDETGLSTNPHLWSSIAAALDESEWFVLLASPESATSPWVDKEIEHWLETKPADRILPTLTSGEWAWNSGAGRLVGDAVPTRLASAITHEPRHLDLRFAHDETDLDLRNRGFRSAVADLAAPMHGVAKDELESEDIRQYRRARRLARSAVGALSLLVVIALLVSMFAIAQRNSARAATAAAHQELLVADSQTQISSNPELATLLAIEADQRSSTTTTRDALLNAILAEPNLQGRFGGEAGDVAVLDDSRIASISVVSNVRGTTLNRNVVQVWNWRTGRRQRWSNAPLGDADTGPLDVSSTSDGARLAVLSSDGMIQLYSGGTLEPQGRPFASELGDLPVSTSDGSPASLALSADGQTLAVDGISPAAKGPLAGDSISVFSRSGDRWTLDPTPVKGASIGLALSPDGSLIATASLTPSGSEIAISAVQTGRTLFRFAAPAINGIAVDWSRDRVVLSQLPGAPGDAVWYWFKDPNPAPHEIAIGSGTQNGQAWATYDATDTRLGLNSSDGAEVLDAETLTPLNKVPIFPTNSYAGPFVFLDADHVLTATFINGPMSVWNLSGTPGLATRPPAQFNLGVFPAAQPGHFNGFSSSDGSLSETFLGPDDRPLGAPVLIAKKDQSAPLAEQVAQTLAPVTCANPEGSQLATVSGATGDITVRASSAPFRISSQDPRGTASLVAPILCAWSPSGRQIAIGNFSPVGHASVVLYNVSRRAVTAKLPAKGVLAVTGLVFSADSKTLWIGGSTYGTNGVYRVTNLDRTPHIAVEFPGASGISADAKSERLVVAYPTAVRVFDARSGTPMTPSISIPGSSIYEVSSSPDGRDAVVNTTQGWRFVDLVAQQPSGPWIPDQNPSIPVMGANDTVYTQAVGGGGEIWDLTATHLRTVACSLVGRSLTEPEWQEYLSWAGPRRATCPQYPLT